MTHKFTGQLTALMVLHTMTENYETTLLLHIDSSERMSTGHHSMSPRVYAANKYGGSGPPPRSFSGLVSDVIIGV